MHVQDICCFQVTWFDSIAQNVQAHALAAIVATSLVTVPGKMTGLAAGIAHAALHLPHTFHGQAGNTRREDGTAQSTAPPV